MDFYIYCFYIEKQSILVNNKQALLLTLEEYSTVKLILSVCIVIRFDFFYFFDSFFLFNYDSG